MPCTPFLEACPVPHSWKRRLLRPRRSFLGCTHRSGCTHPAESLMPLPPALQNLLSRRQGDVSFVRVCSFRAESADPFPCPRQAQPAAGFCDWTCLLLPVCVRVMLSPFSGELSGGSRDPGT